MRIIDAHSLPPRPRPFRAALGFAFMHGLAAALAGLSACYAAPAYADTSHFSFAVLGDTLRSPADEPATQRLIEQEHVPVLIGALCTPVTHAIMPVVQAAKIPLVIATSAGQDFVDASGPSGNDYAFKTIPSEVDIARGLIHWVAARGVKSVAVDGVKPSISTVQNHSYPLSRSTFYYTNGPAEGEAKAFLDFTTSPAGQKIVEQVGFAPLKS